jgi:hypothetical protein
MSNRQQRRASLSEFKREMGHELITHLIDAREPLDAHPLLSRAATHWRDGIQSRKPVCCACKVGFADGSARAGAFLFAQPLSGAPTASVSALCRECWDNLSDDEVEAAALGVMQRLLRKPRFAAP